MIILDGAANLGAVATDLMGELSLMQSEFIEYSLPRRLGAGHKPLTIAVISATVGCDLRNVKQRWNFALSEFGILLRFLQRRVIMW